MFSSFLPLIYALKFFFSSYFSLSNGNFVVKFDRKKEIEAAIFMGKNNVKHFSLGEAWKNVEA